jgi:hypothetical protein
MGTSLQEIRAKLKAQQEKIQGSSAQDKVLFAHWNIDEGATASIRFLPDADTSNDFFWVERLQIRLPFAGVKGQNDKQTTVVVPCVEMWNESCPILAEVRNWFKDKSLEEMGRKYWKKRSYILQGFVRENPMKEEGVENPIRKLLLTPELFKLVREGIMNPEIEEIPTHYEMGLNFNIKKGTKGGYPDYGTSSWARRETALTSEERESIEKHGLYDLKSFLPKKPNDVELKVIKEMFEASVNGEQYDLERWGQYYKPYGLSDNGTKTESQPVAQKVDVVVKTAKTIVEDPAPWDSEDESEVAAIQTPTQNNQKAQDILKLIRERKKD